MGFSSIKIVHGRQPLGIKCLLTIGITPLQPRPLKRRFPGNPLLRRDVGQVSLEDLWKIEAQGGSKYIFWNADGK